MEENPLLTLIKEGKIELSQDGRIIGFNESAILLPVRTLNRLLILLKEDVGESKTRDLLKEIGKFQVKQAFRRYTKTLKWDFLPKERILEFIKKLAICMGFGKYEIRKTKEDNKYTISTSKTPFAEEFLLEYGKQNTPIDFYLAGIWEEVFSGILGKPMICEEVKCYAKGDDCCEFVVKPKEETEEKKE